jgi:hypothetical protein
MSTDDQADAVSPTGGRTDDGPDPEEVREKGRAAVVAAEGLVPPKARGVRAPEGAQGSDAELTSSVLGETSASDKPATDTGVDPEGGTRADATTHASSADLDVPESDLRHSASGPRQSDLDSAGTTRRHGDQPERQ